MAPEALIFDVFGTLVDWRRSIAAEVAEVFAHKGLAHDPAAFADAWRSEYQPSLEPVRCGARPYVALDDLHRENLERVLAAQGYAERFSEPEIATLARAWERLAPWPDVVPGLTRLRTRFLLAPCSNGSIAMMTRLARHAHLPWDCVLGADIARDYKPKPDVYRAACAALRLPPHMVMMVAAHAADLAAARKAGLATAFVPRPEEHGSHTPVEAEPDRPWDITGRDLLDLAAHLV